MTIATEYVRYRRFLLPKILPKILPCCKASSFSSSAPAHDSIAQRENHSRRPPSILSFSSTKPPPLSKPRPVLDRCLASPGNKRRLCKILVHSRTTPGTLTPFLSILVPCHTTGGRRGRSTLKISEKKKKRAPGRCALASHRRVAARPTTTSLRPSPSFFA